MAAPTAPGDSPLKPKRPSSAQRGYGHDWRVFRAKFLKNHPVCCRIGCREPATDVDHEPELQGKDDPGRLDPKRCAPLCKAHHAEKTMAQNRDKVDEGRRAANEKRRLKAAEKKKAAKDAAKYEKKKDAAADHSRNISKKGRDIGPIPEVVNPERRAKALADAEFFNLTYFPKIFYLPFGAPHREAIEQLDYCTENGGQFALTFMRGGGKTQLARAAAIRALCKGTRRYLLYLGATDPHGSRSLKSIFRQFERNDLLLEDFPEICYPIRCLDRIHQRCKGQTSQGEPTLMEITDGHIVLPTVRGSQSSGVALQSAGLTGAFKGINLTTGDGESIRPDMVIIDDAQTRESAKSGVQTDERERIIVDDVMGLAGPETELAAVFLCTPIYVNDLSERFVDRERHPEWQGKRTRMVEQFPTNREWWDNYANVRRDGLRNDDHGQAAKSLYLAEREKADEGCVLSWPGRVKKGKASAIQSAMDLYIDNPVGFKSEYQCEPESAALGDGCKELKAAEIIQRVNGFERGIVPPDMTHVSAFIDCGDNLLWYMVCGWNPLFGGSIIDYGTWPRQNLDSFKKNQESLNTLGRVYPGRTPPQRVHAGLSDLIQHLMGRMWTKPHGMESLKVSQLLVDTGDGETEESVQGAIARFRLYNVRGSKGHGKSLRQGAVGQWKLKQGEERGTHWIRSAGEKGKASIIKFDANFWKTFIYSSLTTPMGGKVGLALFGDKAGQHELLGSHLASESSVPKNLDGYRWDQWGPMPGNPDNDWFDCLVGCAVAASVAGVKINATGSVEKVAKQTPISLRELQERNRAAKEKEPLAPKQDTPTATPAAPAKGKPISLRELQQQNRKGR